MSTDLLKRQLNWFTFELLKMRMNPELVNGKFAPQIIFDLAKIEECTDPHFELTILRQAKDQAEHLLNEIRGFYAFKNKLDPESCGLKYKIEDGKIYIKGYTTAILKEYLKDEHQILFSFLDTYSENRKYYLSFLNRKTGVEISGDQLTVFRSLHKNCKEKNEYLKWDVLYKQIKIRRRVSGENLDSIYVSEESKINHVYQTVAVKLVRLLKEAIGDPSFIEDNIIDKKYGGLYRLVI